MCVCVCVMTATLATLSPAQITLSYCMYVIGTSVATLQKSKGIKLWLSFLYLLMTVICGLIVKTIFMFWRITWHHHFFLLLKLTLRSIYLYSNRSPIINIILFLFLYSLAVIRNCLLRLSFVKMRYKQL